MSLDFHSSPSLSIFPVLFSLARISLPRNRGHWFPFPPLASLFPAKLYSLRQVNLLTLLANIHLYTRVRSLDRRFSIELIEYTSINFSSLFILFLRLFAKVSTKVLENIKYCNANWWCSREIVKNITSIHEYGNIIYKKKYDVLSQYIFYIRLTDRVHRLIFSFHFILFLMALFAKVEVRKYKIMQADDVPEK